MKTTLRTTLLLPLLALACGDVEDESNFESELRVAPTSRAEIETYYIVTRPDYRRCAFPMCGGVFVAELNRQMTTCADGTQAAECYVALADLDATGLSESQQTWFDGRFYDGFGVVRGEFATGSFGLLQAPVIEATEAWNAAADRDPRSNRRSWRADDLGFVCVTFPCVNGQAGRLNTSVFVGTAGIDLTTANAPAARVAEGMDGYFDGSGVLVTGRLWDVTGPAGDAEQLRADEFYTRVEPEVDASCTNDDECDDGEWCGWGDDNVTRECKPFVGEGESCNGFVLPAFRERCEPDLECECIEATCDAPGICVVPDEGPCTSNDDCDDGEWCGFASNPEDRECRPYADIGDSCGGFTLPEFVQICAPGVECVQLNPFLADAPGTCYDQEATYECENDDDCFGVAWCGWDEDENRVCENYQGFGESCGGFVPLADVTQCAPFFTCSVNPLLPDAPGTCGF